MPDQSVKIYHNPRCSKSRETMQIIEDQGIVPEVIEYLNDTPDAQEIRNLCTMLGLSIRELLRSGEDAYKNARLDNPDLTEEQIINVVCENPVLIERPIVVSGNKAVIGRPPTRVLDIIPAQD